MTISTSAPNTVAVGYGGPPMKDSTSGIHEQVEHLGRALGFDAIAKSRTACCLFGSMPLTCRVWTFSGRSIFIKRRHRRSVGHRNVTRLRHLPVVGIEVEGITPTTKAMAADVANIAALGTKLGLLIVSEDGERGIYRRGHARCGLAPAVGRVEARPAALAKGGSRPAERMVDEALITGARSASSRGERWRWAVKSTLWSSTRC